jgi:hypothetical protein
LEEALSIKNATIKISIESLRSKRLIQVEKDMRTGNLFRVPSFLSQGIEMVGKRLSQNPTKSENDQHMGEIRPSLGRNSTIYKEPSSKKLSKRTLSLKECSSIEEYIDSLPTAKMRGRARGCLNGLLEGYSLDTISEGFRFLVHSGIPGSGKQCHSPLSYLESAADSVFDAMSKQTELKWEEDKQLKTNIGVLLKDTLPDESQTIDFEIMQKEFRSKLSESDQALVIANYIENQINSNLRKTISKARIERVAVSEWHRAQLTHKS